MNRNDQHSQQDDKLAEFTDQVLTGRADRTASTADDDLIRLEDTVLRLNRAIPPHSPDNATMKQMLVRLKARVRRDERTVKPSFWKRLFDFQSNPQAGMILAAVVVLVLLVVTLPSLSLDGSSVTGTASGGGGILAAAGVIGALVLIYWFMRRK
jgi:hypothetical protein